MPGFVPPVVGVFDTPTTSIALNVEWRSYIVGILESLLTDCVFGIGQEIYISHKPPVWSGDDDDQFLADNEIQKIISALANGQGLVMIPPGSIQMYAGTTAPEGWLLCDGLDYLKTDYPDLWDVLGATFEMAGNSFKFVVPDMVRRSPIGYDADTPNYDEMGALLGSATHTLTIAQMPQHSHPPGDAAFVTNTYPTTTSYHFVGAGGTNSMNPNSGATGNTGGGQAHNIVHPVTVVNYIIKT